MAHDASLEMSLRFSQFMNHFLNFSSGTASQFLQNSSLCSLVGSGSWGKDPSIWVIDIFSPVAIMREKGGFTFPSLMGSCSNFFTVLWSYFSAPLPIWRAAQ